MRLRLATVLFASIAALACRQPRIDGRNSERARVTITAARSSLPAERRPDFDRYLDLLMRRGAEPPFLADARVREQINGKTASEIINAGEAILREDAQHRMDEKAKHELAEINASFGRAEANDAKMPAVDDDVRQFCAAAKDPELVHRCEWRETVAKQNFTGPLPALPRGVTTSEALQIRITCRNEGNTSWGELAACQDRHLREAGARAESLLGR